MSIVESVLNKAKESGALAAREVKPIERRVTPAPPPAEPSVRPHKMATVDLDSIRRAAMLPTDDHADQLGEEFRRIKVPLVATATGKSGAPRVARGNLVLVTSAVPGEGKSFVSLNLAISLAAERDYRVLLIDADVTKARISRVFGLHDRPGLMELFSDDSCDIHDLILDTNVADLQVLPAGRFNTRSPELFASRRAEQCLAGLAEKHSDQVVIIDSAPLLATSEAQILARIVGQVVMVVRADLTARREVTEAVALLPKGAGVRCVLNQTPAGPFNEQYYYKNESR